MNELEYSNAYRSFRCFASNSISGPIRLAEALRICDTDIPRGDPVSGLRVLAIGAGHGNLLEETLGAVGDEVKVDRLDCVEPNSVMMIELQTRMSLLASKYNFEYKLYQRPFTRESAASFLPNDFYDLLIFSHVFYYFDDPASELEFGMYRLTRKHGRAFVHMDTENTIAKITRDINRCLGRTERDIPHVKFDVPKMDLDEIITAAKTKTVFNSTDSVSVAVHLALKPARPRLNKYDEEIREINDQLLSFVAQRNVADLPENTRVQIQDIIRKHTVESHGFQFISGKLESLLVIRNED